MAKVQAVTTFIVDSGGPKAWLFVKVENSDGLTGWGECYTVPGREQAVVSLLKELGGQLQGRSIYELRHFVSVAYADFAIKRGSMEYYCAISGLEIALWDLIGKSCGQPVYNLLGGPLRQKIPVYANGWFRKFDGSTEAIDAGAEAAQALVDKGFKALKFDPFPGPWRPYIDRWSQDRADECVRAVRAAVGPGVELLIEGHRRLTTPTAIAMGRQFSESRPFWYEEPIPSSHPEHLAEIRRAVNIPIVSGEDLYRKEDFRALFQNRAVDIVNPDVTSCGGILPLLEIGSMADANLVGVAPHNYNSPTIGLAATVQASALMPNFIITEYFVNFEERKEQIVERPLILEDGCIVLGTAPGLGVNLVEAELDAFQTRGTKPHSLPNLRGETS